MNKTIHQLDAITQAETTDELIVYDVSAGTSKKISAENARHLAFPDYSQIIQSGITADGFTAQEDCYLNVCYISIRTNQTITCELKIDGTTVVTNDSSTISTTQNINIVSWSGYIKKGSTVYWYFDGTPTSTSRMTFYKLSS